MCVWEFTEPAPGAADAAGMTSAAQHLTRALCPVCPVLPAAAGVSCLAQACVSQQGAAVPCQLQLQHFDQPTHDDLLLLLRPTQQLLAALCVRLPIRQQSGTDLLAATSSGDHQHQLLHPDAPANRASAAATASSLGANNGAMQLLQAIQKQDTAPVLAATQQGHGSLVYTTAPAADAVQQLLQAADSHQDAAAQRHVHVTSIAVTCEDLVAGL